MNADKFLGGLLGGAIGDAWGAPVEVFTPEQIFKVHPAGVPHYVEPICHKFFKPEDLPLGTITDDTQTTLATLLAVIVRGFDMDTIAMAHIQCMRDGTLGFGKSTLEAMQRLQNGVAWSKSGKSDIPGRGYGNGIPMKCFPLAAWHVTEDGKWVTNFNQQMVKFAAMTHYTKMAAMSGIVHAYALEYCLTHDAETFDRDEFLYAISHHPFEWARIPSHPKTFNVDYLEDSDDHLQAPLMVLWDYRHEIPHWSVDKIRGLFGNGSPYVYNTLPFCYAFFYQNPYSFDTGRKVIEAGGDTDTNAKIVLEMIGALHGQSIFWTDENSWAPQGLLCREQLMTAGNTFCRRYHLL